ncbi:hypothetical protein [Polyangium mundeleinium]|uniref:Uncharacterized protein n=1 Tax=Polyangium mundeleinium TaxID=2995306 RepID=A0ABT5EQE0_9BACT|nr:hypothetical protein [Polyangium mundeleinium]MDC0742931.1 hypothetical protein [Polyangium mundeleinium]
MVKRPLSPEDEIMALQKLIGADLPENCEITLEIRDLDAKLNDAGTWMRGAEAIGSPSARVTIQRSGNQVFKKLDQLVDLRLMYW